MSRKLTIESTAKDYDLDECIVERIYDRYWNTTKFYEKLEEELAE